MISNFKSLTIIITAIAIGSLISTSTSFADEQKSDTQTIPIDGTIGIEKTVVILHASSDNALPWGFVEGKISNHVSDYPVIIQIYDNDGEAVHFAQSNVEEDGTYEYKFRVLSINDGNTIKIFDGDYTVNIFKVVYLNPGSVNLV